MRDFRTHHTANRNIPRIVDGEFLAADVECIESVGAVFEEVFFWFSELFA